MSAIAAGAGVGTGVVVGEVDLVGGLRGLPAAGARQRVAKIGPVRVEHSRRLQLRELPIPAMVPDRGDGGGVDDRLRPEAQRLVCTEQGSEDERRVATGRGPHRDQPIDLVLGDQLFQRVGRGRDRLAVAFDALVVPRTAQVAHEQAFRGDLARDREELEWRHPHVPVHAAEGDQQRARVAVHVDAQGHVGIFKAPAKAAFEQVLAGAPDGLLHAPGATPQALDGGSWRLCPRGRSDASSHYRNCTGKLRPHKPYVGAPATIMRPACRRSRRRRRRGRCCAAGRPRRPRPGGRRPCRAAARRAPSTAPGRWRRAGGPWRSGPPRD